MNFYELYCIRVIAKFHEYFYTAFALVARTKLRELLAAGKSSEIYGVFIAFYIIAMFLIKFALLLE